ncbi:MAG: FAD-dependent thymidylate synthase, partial [Candidatus Thermoplasmatota archaeon]
MKWVEPRIFKIGETGINREGLIAFLRELGANDWMEKQPWYSQKSGGIDPGTTLIEIAGRACYKSFGVGLNPNITKIRESTKDYVENVLQKGDGSIFEHAGCTIAFVDVSRVFCYSEDTEVLTNEGWKPWPSVRGTELFASMTPDRELVFEPAEQRFAGSYEGPMYHVR